MLTLDQSPPVKFLMPNKKGKGEVKVQKAKRFLMILPDDIASRNFSYAVLKEGVSQRIFETTTFEGLARDILDPNRRKKPRILEKSVLVRLMVEIVKQSSSGPLMYFHFLPLENPDVQEALIDEFDEYLRCCDAGALHAHLVDRVRKLGDPFVKESSLRCIEAFKTLEGLLLKKVASLGPSVFLSRSYLLRKAREGLPSSWPSRLVNIQEIFVASISVFDASALKFIVKLVETGELPRNRFDVRIFPGKGTYTRLATRLLRAGVSFREEGERELPKAPSAAAILVGRGRRIPEFLAAPERRREVEAIANRIHKLFLSGACLLKNLLRQW